MNKQDFQTAMNNADHYAAAEIAINRIIEAEKQNNARHGDLKNAFRKLIGQYDFNEKDQPKLASILADLETFLSIHFGRMKFVRNPDEAKRDNKPYVTNADLNDAYRRAYKSIREVFKEAGFKVEFKANDADYRASGKVRVSIAHEKDGETARATGTKKGADSKSANDANMEGASDAQDHDQSAAVQTFATPDSLVQAALDTLDDDGRAYLVAQMIGTLDTKALHRLSATIDATLAERSEHSERQADIDAADAELDAMYDEDTDTLIESLTGMGRNVEHMA